MSGGRDGVGNVSIDLLPLLLEQAPVGTTNGLPQSQNETTLSSFLVQQRPFTRCLYLCSLRPQSQRCREAHRLNRERHLHHWTSICHSFPILLRHSLSILIAILATRANRRIRHPALQLPPTPTFPPINSPFLLIPLLLELEGDQSPSDRKRCRCSNPLRILHQDTSSHTALILRLDAPLWFS